MRTKLQHRTKIGLLTAVIGAAAIAALLIFGTRPRRHAEPVDGFATRTAIRMASDLRSLERDLAAFLLADGDQPTAVAARVAEADRHFAWAQPLFVLDARGTVLNRSKEADFERDRQLRNLLRRAVSSEAIASETPAQTAVETGSRGRTVRFSAANPRLGVRVLINLERDALWVAYRLRPEALERLLEPGHAAARPHAIALSLINPNGRPLGEQPPQSTVRIKAWAPIEIAPGWRVIASRQEDRVATLFEARDPWKLWDRGTLLVLFTVLGAAGLFIARPRQVFRPEKGHHGASTVNVEPQNPATEPTVPRSTAAAENEIRVGNARIDLRRYTVTRGTTEHALTEREVDLLRMLIDEPNVVLRRDRLLDEVWGYSSEATTRTLDTFIYRLRQKIERDPSTPRHLLTVRGTGYRFVP